MKRIKNQVIKIQVSCRPTIPRHMPVVLSICLSEGQLQLQGPNSSCEVLT